MPCSLFTSFSLPYTDWFLRSSLVNLQVSDNHTYSKIEWCVFCSAYCMVNVDVKCSGAYVCADDKGQHLTVPERYYGQVSQSPDRTPSPTRKARARKSLPEG